MLLITADHKNLCRIFKKKIMQMFGYMQILLSVILLKKLFMQIFW